MYFGRGFALNEIGDCNVVAHEGKLHMFHVCMPSHDVVAHVVSEDGVHWTPMPWALRVGDPGECDDDQIWTMSVFRWEGRFYMLYTALTQADDGLIQRSGLAVSDDLIRWEKAANNPVAAPDPRWYESDTEGCGRADWRDPFGWVEADTIHAFVCAHLGEGPQNRRGCVGHFTSQDAVNWEVQPPFVAPGLASDFEVPAMMKLGGRYYLMGHTCAPPQGIYRWADSFEGPWHRPDNDWILPRGAHIFCPVEWKERMLIFHWLEAPFDWVDRRRVTGPANAQRMIAPPKEAVSLPDGTLELRSCEYLWDELSTQTVTPSLAVALDGVYDGGWEYRAGALHGFSVTGMGVAVLPGSSADFVLETTITLEDAREAGLFFRGAEDANVGTFVSLVPSRQRAELHRVLVGSPYEPRRLGRGIVVLQETHLPLDRNKPVRVRVVAWGPYVEISFDGRVMLCFMTMSRRRGRIGFFVNDGHATFADVKLQILQKPPMPEAQE